ncbi:peptidylprolyl isomerase [Dehalococcoidia bacterium]|nr:peptidylprolyl isomerase [Dehalococcoidia bacterium]
MVIILILLVTEREVSVKGPENEPFLQVNNRTFVWRDYVDLLRFTKLGTESLGGRFDAGTEPYRLVQNMAEGELIRQAAPREGLYADDQLVRQEMISRLVDNAADIDPKDAERELRVRLGNYLATVQLSRDKYHEIVETDLLRDQLREKIGSPLLLPRVQPHALIHFIVLTENTDQAEVQRRLDEGESFASVARDVSADENTSLQGGKFGWTPRLVFRDFDTNLFGLREGQVSEPIMTDDGVYLVRMVERVGNQARLEVILLKNRAEAREVERRFDSGFTFGELSAQHSIDPNLREVKGDLGMVSVGDYNGKFDQLIHGMPLNKPSGPFSASQGTYYFLVEERTEAREVSEDHLAILKGRALEDWISREWDQNLINYCPERDDNCFGSIKVSRALDEIKNVSQTNFQADATATAQEARRDNPSPI